MKENWKPMMSWCCNWKAFTTCPQWQATRNRGGKLTIPRARAAALLTMFCWALAAFAQPSKTVTEGPMVVEEFKHDTGPLLREVAPLFPEFGTPAAHAIQTN